MLLPWITPRWSGLLAAVLLAGWPGGLCAQAVRLNEIQSANANTFRDERGETPDWIELYNADDSAVNLSGWGLSDDVARPFKWTFGDVTLPPAGLLLVFASGENWQTGGTPALAPTNVAGLKVWLQADAISPSDPAQVRFSGGEYFLRQWRDQGPFGWHAEQADVAAQPRYLAALPEFAGMPAVRFDGLNDLLRLPDAPGTNDFCMVVVARASAGHEVDPQAVGGYGGVMGQRYVLGAEYGGPDSAGAGLSFGTNGVSAYEHGANSLPAVAVAPRRCAGVTVLALNYSQRQAALWVHGNPAGHGAVSVRPNVTAPLSLGAGSYGAFAGDVAEVLAFDRALTDAELMGVQQYLAERYGLTLPRAFHTNFKLAAEGEALFLTRPNGTLADTVPATPLPRDISLGRQPDGTGEWLLFDQPTPGAPNLTPGGTERLAPPTFSVPAGFYAYPVLLGLSHADATAQIRFTLDGTEPDATSPRFTSVLTLTNRTPLPNDLSLIPTADGWQPPLTEVAKGLVIRARAFRAGALPSPTATATYFVDPQGRERYALPVVSLATDRRHFFAPDTGIYVCGNAPGCNFTQEGEAWERPIHVELFETNGTRVLAQESGVRLHGATSVYNPLKALRLHPLNQHGGEPFRYQVFPDLALAEFDRLLLRPAGQDGPQAMMRDALTLQLVRELGLDVQACRPAIVFLNGEYWGLHYLQEAFEKNYFARHHPGVDPEALDYLEGYAPGPLAVIGDSARFDAFTDWLATADLREATNAARAQSFIEWENYRDYKLVETFTARWDIGNQRVWRPRTAEGRLRWILFDCDVGFGGAWAQPVDAPWTFNMLAYNLEPNGPWQNYLPGNDHNIPAFTFQLRALLTNPGLQQDFINRGADLLNAAFAPARTLEFINRLAGEISSSMAEHCARWRYPADWLAWSNEVQRLRRFAEERPAILRQHLTDQFGLAGWVEVTLSVADTNAGTIRWSTLSIAAPINAPWTGSYVRDHPIRVAAEPQPGWQFKQWQGLTDSEATNSAPTLTLTGPLTLVAEFEPIPGYQPNFPAPFALASGPYAWTRWAATEPAGTYPPSMVFLQTAPSAAADPGLPVEFTNHWRLPYDRTSRSRLNGLGEDGLAFLNTSDPQADAGYLGAAVLALDTRGVPRLQVAWRGGTVTPNPRAYALRLQYRVGATNVFADVLDAAGLPVEYQRHALAGHTEQVGPTLLPLALANQPYVQLRWKYYWRSGSSGARDQLRLDDVMVAPYPLPAPTLASASVPQPGRLRMEFRAVPNLRYTLEGSTDLTTWAVLGDVIAGADGQCVLEVALPPGLPARFHRLRWP